MNPLAQLIARHCAAAGPMTVADYMAMAMGHPEYGYYMTGDPFGKAGDFITAPEISQTFGELIGLWSVATWRQMGEPDPFVLAELGPGRGTLMADALRAARQAPDFLRAAQVTLVETSPTLRARQRQTLAPHEVVWCDSFERIDTGPVLVLANEFFDALPARQLVRAETGWQERLVAGGDEGLFFTHSAADAASAALLAPDLRQGAPLGAVAELQPAALALIASIADRIARQGGAALIVDYGYVQSAAGDTLQAVRKHKPHDVLSDPGEADLTVHVDFAALVRAAGEVVRCSGPVGQGEFLRALGIEMRARQLCAAADTEQARDIAAGVTRLIAPEQMGTLFKVLALSHHDMGPLPGFESTD